MYVYVYVYVYKVLYLLSLADAFVAQGMPDSAARVYRQALSGDVCVSGDGGGVWGGGRECVRSHVCIRIHVYLCMYVIYICIYVHTYIRIYIHIYNVCIYALRPNSTTHTIYYVFTL
jgi:hypothetical protein